MKEKDCARESGRSSLWATGGELKDWELRRSNDREEVTTITHGLTLCFLNGKSVQLCYIFDQSFSILEESQKRENKLKSL